MGVWHSLAAPEYTTRRLHPSHHSHRAHQESGFGTAAMVRASQEALRLLPPSHHLPQKTKLFPHWKPRQIYPLDQDNGLQATVGFLPGSTSHPMGGNG